MSRLRTELQEAGEEKERLACQVAENQALRQELDLLTERHRAAQQEVYDRKGYWGGGGGGILVVYSSSPDTCHTVEKTFPHLFFSFLRIEC